MRIGGNSCDFQRKGGSVLAFYGVDRPSPASVKHAGETSSESRAPPHRPRLHGHRIRRAPRVRGGHRDHRAGGDRGEACRGCPYPGRTRRNQHPGRGCRRGVQRRPVPARPGDGAHRREHAPHHADHQRPQGEPRDPGPAPARHLRHAGAQPGRGARQQRQHQRRGGRDEPAGRGRQAGRQRRRRAARAEGQARGASQAARRGQGHRGPRRRAARRPEGQGRGRFSPSARRCSTTRAPASSS